MRLFPWRRVPWAKMLRLSGARTGSTCGGWPIQNPRAAFVVCKACALLLQDLRSKENLLPIIAESRRIEKTGKAQSTRAANASFAITVLTKDRASVISLLHIGLVIPMPNVPEESASGQRVGSADSSAFGFGMTKNKVLYRFCRSFSSCPRRFQTRSASPIPRKRYLSQEIRFADFGRPGVVGLWTGWTPLSMPWCWFPLFGSSCRAPAFLRPKEILACTAASYSRCSWSDGDWLSCGGRLETSSVAYAL